MSEPLRCFNFLVENAPGWVSQVEQLEQRIKERRDEIARIPVPVSKHKVRKTGSTESIRPGKNLGENRSGEASSEGQRIEVTSAPQEGDLPGAQNGRQCVLQAQRKRKTTSVLSNYTAPAKCRSRSMIIVYYDSIVQEVFNSLVQSISTGRNHLRKAKMAARMEALTRQVAAGADSEDRYSPPRARRSPYAIASGRLAIPVANSIGSPASRTGVPNGATLHDPLTAADAALESAQSYCERGAHQFLREGDCLKETSGAKAAFHDVLLLARQQTERLREEEKIRERRRRQRDKEARELHLATMAVGATNLALSTSVPAPALQLDAPLEADDGESDEELGDTDLAATPPPFRLMART